MTIVMDPETRKIMCAILDDAPDLAVATIRPDGFPQATTVSFVHDDGVIYFGCDPDSQKAKNIAADDRVSLTVTPPYEKWEKIRGLSVGARAKPVVSDDERFHVRGLMLKRFPQVADYVKSGAAEEIALFRIDPVVVSILDYARGFGHTELHEVASAEPSL